MTVFLVLLLIWLEIFAVSGDDINHFINKLQEVAQITIPSSCRVVVQSNSSHGVEGVQWKKPYQVEVTHISKTGGVSFNQEIGQIFGTKTYGKDFRERKGGIFAAEKCYENNKAVGAKTIVMLRSPAFHVFSQFNQFYNTSYGFKNRAEDFPDTRNLKTDYITWLQHFTSLSDEQVGENYDYNAYDPRDFQTRFMSCDSADYGPPTHFPHHAHYPPPDLNRAVRNLQGADFVGLTDLYTESICLLEVYVHGAPSPRCICNNQKSSDFIHEDHGVEHLPLQVLLEDEIDSHVYKLTMMDRMLFANALLRFLCDIRLAEAYLNEVHESGSDSQAKRLVCPGKLSELRQNIRYLGLFER